MKFVQDFLSFGSLGVLGVILVGIGVLGCLFHRQPFRLAACAGVSFAGSLLLLDGAAKMHRTEVPMAFVIVFAVITLAGIVRAVLAPATRAPDRNAATHPSEAVRSQP